MTVRDEVTVTSCLRVLLVEDSKVLAERLAETITQNTRVELVAQADTEAAALVVVERESIDVVVLDLHLKRGTGFGVLRGLALPTSSTNRGTTGCCPAFCMKCASHVGCGPPNNGNTISGVAMAGDGPRTSR
jgi:response regulator RpfG family c-di-GMP phosphodiesterase